MNEIRLHDYSLVGKDTASSIEGGLAEATWYASRVPKQKMRELLERRDGPAIRDTVLWFALIIGSGLCGFMLWGTWWAMIPFAIYGVLYASTSDSRWHEPSHGTAFKTDWMNNALYEIASFMVLRESTRWRWSHARHHSDTIIVGRDPEIAVTRPPHWSTLLLRFFGINTTFAFFRGVFLHSSRRLTAEEKTFIPESEYGKVFARAYIYILIYASVLGLSIYTRRIVPLMFIGLPAFYGSWLQFIYGHTQHAGLAENVLDHRLNTRTIYLHPIHRYLYWQMNYHLEHHMFPLVPYHNLARLHELVKADMPRPYRGLLEAWGEIIPTLIRQRKDPTYYVKRELPTPSIGGEGPAVAHVFTAKGTPVQGWIEICASRFLRRRRRDSLRSRGQDLRRLPHRRRQSVCHGRRLHARQCPPRRRLGVAARLIECAKHNGRFDLTDGSPQRQPACVALKTYKAREHEGKIFLDLNSAGGCGLAESPSATDSAWSATATLRRSSRNSCWNPSRDRRYPSISRAITCNSTSRPTRKYHSAKSP